MVAAGILGANWSGFSSVVPSVRSLWPEGRVFADEWNHSACELAITD
jgi:hypothetical protein